MSDTWRDQEKKERRRVMRVACVSVCAFVAAATAVVLLWPMKGSVDACTVKSVVKEKVGKVKVDREEETVYRFARAGWWMRENKLASLAAMALVLGGVALLHLTYKQRPGRRAIILTLDAVIALGVGFLFVVWLGESLEVARLTSMIIGS